MTEETVLARGRRFAGGLVAALVVLAAANGAAAGSPPTTEDQLVAGVRAALTGRDLASLEELVPCRGSRSDS